MNVEHFLDYLFYISVGTIVLCYLPWMVIHDNPKLRAIARRSYYDEGSFNLNTTNMSYLSAIGAGNLSEDGDPLPEALQESSENGNWDDYTVAMPSFLSKLFGIADFFDELPHINTTEKHTTVEMNSTSKALESEKTKAVQFITENTTVSPDNKTTNTTSATTQDVKGFIDVEFFDY